MPINNVDLAYLFDLDGTLANSKAKISRRMAEELERVSKKFHLAIVTGGKFEQIKDNVLSVLGKSKEIRKIVLFANSGGRIVKCCRGRWATIYEEKFSILEECKIHEAIDDAVKKSHLKEMRLWGKQIESRGSQITWSGLGQEAPYKHKILWDKDRLKRNKIISNFDCAIKNLEIRVNATTSIDITKPFINKAFAVRSFSLLTGIPIHRMMYIGDALFSGGNDEIVKVTGIKTKQVNGPHETIMFLKSL